jgi:hypothetical protein
MICASIKQEAKTSIIELRKIASKKAPLEAGLRVLGDSNSATIAACQLGAVLV